MLPWTVVTDALLVANEPWRSKSSRELVDASVLTTAIM
jgi:hypothetical protein